MSDDRFDYESELSDEDNVIEFGKYRGHTPLDVLQRDPGYITWATKAFPQGWVGSQKIIEAAARIVPSQDVHVKAIQKAKLVAKHGAGDKALVAAFEECMLETFGEFPTPYWKTL